MSKVNKTKVECPKCGAEFAIPAHETVAIGVVIGQDSNLGIVHPPLAENEPKPRSATKAQERIEALRAVGVDVSHLFAVLGANGSECIASDATGTMMILAENDPIFALIKTKGTIPNRKLFRRWVLAQMFRHMTNTSYKTGKLIGVTASIHRLGYEYQWKMVLNELYAQLKMAEGKDMNNFNDRHRWFNSAVVAAMANDYIDKLKARVDKLQTYKCKGIPYKRICKKNYFVDDLQAKLYRPLYYAMCRIKSAKSIKELYEATVKFNEMRYSMAWETPQCKEWLDAYKGSGSFFSMQNLIRFHGCKMVSDNGVRLTKDESYRALMAKAIEYQGEGWRMLGVLKRLLSDNNIDIKAKMAEWRK